MDSNKDLLSISEMAKLRKVTPETLRHYDRIGLFTPNYTSPETGYRYYSFTQYETLGTIKELAQMGMRLEDIKAYLENRDLNSSIDVLEKQHEKLIEEIQHKKALEKIVTDKLEFLHSLKENSVLGEVFEREYPERYMITDGKMGVTTKEMCLKITGLEGIMEEIAPVFASNKVGAFSSQSLEALDPGTERFDFAPFIFCEKKYKKSDKFRTVPAGRFLCIRYHGRFGTYSDTFKKIVEYMSNNNLEQCGCFYTNYELDVTVTRNFDETFLMLQVPVKEK